MAWVSLFKGWLRAGRTLGLLALPALMAGCRVIGAAVIVTVGVVGLAGYAVYKTGEVVVTGVGAGVGAVGAGVVAAGAAVGGALTPDSKPETEATAKPVSTVVLTDNEFKTDYLASFDRTWKAANATFQKAGFKDIAGEADSGVLTAQAWEGTGITVKLKSLEPLLTEARIRVGSKGNIKTAETVHKWMLAELTQKVAP